MPTLEDLQPFLPFAVIALCLLVGKAMKGATRIPDWLIPPVLAGTGALAGAAEGVVGGAPWKQALLTACSGLIAVGLHQTGRAAARQSTNAKPDPLLVGAADTRDTPRGAP